VIDGAGAAVTGAVVRAGCWGAAGTPGVTVDGGAWLVQPLNMTASSTRLVQNTRIYFIGTPEFVFLNKYADLNRE
jgi:hypothetical protein